MSIETTDKLKDFQNELEVLLKKYNAKLYPVNKNSYDLFQLVDSDLSIVVEINNISLPKLYSLNSIFSTIYTIEKRSNQNTNLELLFTKQINRYSMDSVHQFSCNLSLEYLKG